MDEEVYASEVGKEALGIMYIAVVHSQRVPLIFPRTLASVQFRPL